jgi:hypothetical protein
LTTLRIGEVSKPAFPAGRRSQQGRQILRKTACVNDREVPPPPKSSRTPSKTSSPGRARINTKPTREAAPTPREGKRNPTDCPKATSASAPTMQPNPAQSSLTRDSLATFATVVCQSRVPEAASIKALGTNKMPQEPTLPQKQHSETPEANNEHQS